MCTHIIDLAAKIVLWHGTQIINWKFYANRVKLCWLKFELDWSNTRRLFAIRSSCLGPSNACAHRLILPECSISCIVTNAAIDVDIQIARDRVIILLYIRILYVLPHRRPSINEHTYMLLVNIFGKHLNGHNIRCVNIIFYYSPLYKRTV